MKMRSDLLFILVMGWVFSLAAVSVHATTLDFETDQLPQFQSDYDRDFYALQKGLYIVGLDSNIPDKFRNPHDGAANFILPVDSTPWAGNYFPMHKGGLANRWQVKSTVDINDLPKKKQILAMPSEEISLLSPIEKYDILMGNYKFAATRRELTQRGPLRPWPVANWEGFCNGVRCAGMRLPEPTRAIEVTNRDGVKVNFQPADLKALAGASYFFVEKYSQMGAPTQQGGKAEDQPNPAVFDLALRYFVAEKKKSFVIDSHLGEEIWNESVIGYKRQIESAANLDDNEMTLKPGAISKINVKVNLLTLSEIDIKISNEPTKQKVADGKLHREIPIEYTLFLDKDGKAIDGEWKKSRTFTGVDFVWFGGGKGTDSEHPEGNGNQSLYFSVIENLMNKASTPFTCKSILLR